MFKLELHLVSERDGGVGVCRENDNRGVTHLPDVDPSSEFPSGMPGTEVSDGGNGVEASVLCQREGDHFQGLCEGTETVLLHARQGVGVGSQALRQLCLGGTASSDQCSATQQVSFIRAMGSFNFSVTFWGFENSLLTEMVDKLVFWKSC